MAKDKPVEKPAPVVPMLRSDFISVLILGAVVGLAIWGIGALLDRYVFDAYFCQAEVTNQCANAKNYAAVSATLIVAIAAMAGLIRLRVYRPLLVLIVSLVSLWGVAQTSWNLGWFTGALAMVLLYSLAFGLFSWIARIREFWVTFAVIFVLVLIVRLALMV